VYTITSEDIRRSGHQSLAEVLRMIPGMQVARADSRQWGVSARGLTSVFAKELLVLVDSRIVYDPGFAGVWWDIQSLVLEDIDRIEVIRGPGATLWGANAVNGVINITTKSARDTQGVYLTAGAGNEEKGFAALRYGGRLGGSAHFRVWGKYRAQGGTRSQATGGDVPDEWNLPQAGVRLDAALGDRTQLTFLGGGHRTERLGASTLRPLPQYSLDPANPFVLGEHVSEDLANGFHLNAQLQHKTKSGATWTGRAVLERSRRTVFIGTDLSNTIADLDLRHHRKVGDRHELMAGAEWRFVHDRAVMGETVGEDPETDDAHTISGFLQDTVTLSPQKLTLMVGSKLEHNAYTGFEVQPSARLAYTPDARHTFWAALSRAVRTPARSDRDVRVTVGYLDPFLLATGTPSFFFLPVQVRGSRDVVSESLLATEAGYRIQLGEAFSADTAVFFNRYRDLLGIGEQIQPAPDALVFFFRNAGDADSYGGELVLNWRPSSRLRATGSYSYLTLKTDGGVNGSFARHLGTLRASARVADDVELNGALYYTGPTRTLDNEFDAHLRADVGLTWRPSAHVELAAWAQDVGSRRHAEFDSATVSYHVSEIERSVYGQVTLRP
jgi:iron complex outermembrane receptor protein